MIGFDGAPVEGKPYYVDWDAAAAEKGGYPNFMTKEIQEQPHAVADTLLGRTDQSGRLVLDELRISETALRSVDKIVVIACGTASYAGMVAQVRHRALDPHPRARSSWRTSSATATRSSTVGRWSCRSASPARPWTRSWRSSTPASSAP